MDERTILVVDDDEAIRTVFGLGLRARGYDVLEAENGEVCVRLARQHRPGLILLDLMMPVQDGWQAARELQADPATADIPRVAITARDLGPATRAALAASFDLVLSKPIRLADLYARVEEMLGPPPEPGEAG